MRSGIREFQPRQPLDRQLGASTLNAILRELESLRITRVVNGTFRKLPGGTEITVAPQRGGGTSAPATTHPFEIKSFVDPESDPESPSYLATVRPGAINQIISASHFDGAELAEFAISADTLTYIILTATTNGKEITSATIATDTAAPTPQTPTLFTLPTEVKYTLGLVYNGSVYQIITNNINVSGKIVYTANKTSAATPGELPFDIYYHWQ